MACLKLNLVRREVTSRTKKNSNETSKWLEYKISSLFFESCYKSQNCYPMFWKFRGGGKCPKCSLPGCSPATGYAVMRSWCKLQLNEILKCQKRIKEMLPWILWIDQRTSTACLFSWNRFQRCCMCTSNSGGDVTKKACFGNFGHL